jgi:hypothetical protein
MSVQFEYLPDAIEEAWEAYHWYAERSDSAAEGFLRQLQLARESVTERPDAWSRYFHGTRCFRLKRYPFGLI